MSWLRKQVLPETAKVDAEREAVDRNRPGLIPYGTDTATAAGIGGTVADVLRVWDAARALGAPLDARFSFNTNGSGGGYTAITWPVHNSDAENTAS